MIPPISDRVAALLPRVREFVEHELQPLEPALVGGHGADFDLALAASRARAKQIGIWAPHLPIAYGGLALTLVDFAHISELLGRSPLGHFACNCQAPDVGNMEILLHHGNHEQRRTWLEPLARGELRSAFAMTEPEHAGSNPTSMSTTAVLDEDSYVINGHKWFASSFDGAAFVIVMAITHPDAPRHERASQLIVPAGTPGLVHVRNIPVMGDPGRGYMSHAELRFEDCRVAVTNRLGPAGRGFAVAQERLGPGRIHHCMRWIGVAERAFDLMCRRVVAREVRPGQPLADNPIVHTWIAESRAEIDASRLLVLKAAATIDAQGARAARLDISLIKFFVAGMLQRVLDRAIQAHGALGVSDDCVLAFWYRHERAARIYDGPDEVHKSLAAREVLKKYLSPTTRSSE